MEVNYIYFSRSWKKMNSQKNETNKHKISKSNSPFAFWARIKVGILRIRRLYVGVWRIRRIRLAVWRIRRLYVGILRIRRLYVGVWRIRRLYVGILRIRRCLEIISRFRFRIQVRVEANSFWRHLKPFKNKNCHYFYHCIVLKCKNDLKFSTILRNDRNQSFTGSLLINLSQGLF